MSIGPGDVQALSASSPGPGGVPLPAAKLARIAAVLNGNSTPPTGARPVETDPAGGGPPLR